jgi:hypothetical protein
VRDSLIGTGVPGAENQRQQAASCSPAPSASSKRRTHFIVNYTSRIHIETLLL